MSPTLNLKKRAKVSFLAAYEAHQNQELDKAIYLYSHSLEWYPTTEAYTFLGWAYSHKGKFERAIEECKKAIEVDPEFGNPYNDIGAYLVEQGKGEEAIPWLQKAMLAKRYESPWFPHFNLGRIWEKRFEYEEALKEFGLSLEQKPDFEPARKALERVRGKIKDRE